MQQELAFDTGRTAAQLVGFIKSRVGRFVRIALHRNRVTMASVRFERDGSITLRLHEAFRKAPDEVLEALCQYLETQQRQAWVPVQAYARQIVPRDQPAKGQPPAGGTTHDLSRIAEEVNRRYFSGRVHGHVRWGKAGLSRGRRRSIRYGSWNGALREVRIHPALDDPCVPEAFVAYIIFHEYLHAVVPPDTRGGRCIVHGATFRSLERQFPDYDHMQRLAKKLLHRLA